MNFLSADSHICDHWAAAENRCSPCNSQWDHQRFSMDDTLRHTFSAQWVISKLTWNLIIVMQSSICNQHHFHWENFVCSDEPWNSAFTETLLHSGKKLHILIWFQLLQLFHGSNSMQICKNQAICKYMQINCMHWKDYFASVCTAHSNSLLDFFLQFLNPSLCWDYRQ